MTRAKHNILQHFAPEPSQYPSLPHDDPTPHVQLPPKPMPRTTQPHYLPCATQPPSEDRTPQPPSKRSKEERTSHVKASSKLIDEFATPHATPPSCTAVNELVAPNIVEGLVDPAAPSTASDALLGRYFLGRYLSRKVICRKSLLWLNGGLEVIHVLVFILFYSNVK